MDWLDLLAVQGTLKSLLQHHSSKASILQCSAFFTIQLSHPYMTTGKTIALTWQTFVGKVMSLLFNMLSRLVITFLPRSKCLLILWLQWPSAVILEPQKIMSDTVSTVSSCICHEVMGPDAMIFVFWMLICKQQLVGMCSWGRELVTTYRGEIWWDVGGRIQREGTYVYLWLIHVDVWQKPTEYCKAIILQLKIN